MREKVEGLKDHAHLGKDLLRSVFARISDLAVFVLGKKFSIDCDRAALDGFQMVQAAQKRTLAGP